MSDQKATPEMASEFTKYLVELTHYGFVDDDTNEIRDIDGKPIEVTLTSTQKPMMIFGPKLIADNHVILNVFSDNAVEGAQVSWFWRTHRAVLGTMAKMVIDSAITYKSQNDDSDFIKMELAHILKGDTKMKADFEKISFEDLLTVFYQKKTKTAQLQTKIFDKEYIATLDIKKKYWDVFQKTFLTIFKVQSVEEFNQVYKFTSKLISVPKCEAKLMVIRKGLDALTRYTEAFLGIKYDTSMFDVHMPQLHQYYIVSAWSDAPVASRMPEPVQNAQPVASHWSTPAPVATVSDAYKSPMERLEEASKSAVTRFTGPMMGAGPKSPFDSNMVNTNIIPGYTNTGYMPNIPQPMMNMGGIMSGQIMMPGGFNMNTGGGVLYR